MKRKLYSNAFFPIGFIIFAAAGLLLTTCGDAVQAKRTYIIGVVSETIFDAIVDGFKTAMTELGYAEGKNITYIYHGNVGTDPEANDAVIRSLLGQKADLLLTLGTAPSLAAKRAVEGTGTPVVFVPIMNPVEEGIVASIGHPGGNLTGIQIFSPTPKALEWLLKIAPGTKRVYIPYHPADQVALASINTLPDVAAKLGVDLVLDEVSSSAEELAGIKALPEGSAIFFVISPSLIPSLEDAAKLAVELRIPAGVGTNLTDSALFRYTLDQPQGGKQAAVLADKIFKGSKPGDLPVESGEFYLSINLKTAEAIGLYIPDEILRQAQKIIR